MPYTSCRGTDVNDIVIQMKAFCSKSHDPSRLCMCHLMSKVKYDPCLDLWGMEDKNTSETWLWWVLKVEIHEAFLKDRLRVIVISKYHCKYLPEALKVDEHGLKNPWWGCMDMHVTRPTRSATSPKKVSWTWRGIWCMQYGILLMFQWSMVQMIFLRSSKCGVQHL